jgi:hypothetical protein
LESFGDSEEDSMPRRYSPEVRRQVVELARAGTTTGQGANATSEVTVQAPYSGRFVLAVCQPDGGSCSSGGYIRPMDPYTFTTTEGGGITPPVAVTGTNSPVGSTSSLPTTTGPPSSKATMAQLEAALATAFGLPSGKACYSRRAFEIHIRQPHGYPKIVSAEVFLGSGASVCSIRRASPTRSC